MFGLKERITRCKKANYEPPLIIKGNRLLRPEEVERINTGLKKNGIDNFIILPQGFEIEQRNPDYRIFTKEDFRKYWFNCYMNYTDIRKDTVDFMERVWNKTRKEHNFVIAVGKGDNLHFFSVKGFEEMVLGVKE